MLRRRNRRNVGADHRQKRRFDRVRKHFGRNIQFVPHEGFRSLQVFSRAEPKGQLSEWINNDAVLGNFIPERRFD